MNELQIRSGFAAHGLLGPQVDLWTIGSVLIDSEMLGFFFFHFPLYMVDDYICLLQFDDSIVKRTLQSNLVEHKWVHKTWQWWIFHLNWMTVRFSTQGIRNHVGLARMVVHLEIIIFNPLKPPLLSHIQFRLSEDVLETLMIGVDVAQITKQIVPPDFQSMDNCSQF